MRGSAAGRRGYPLRIVLTRNLLAAAALAVASVPAALAQTVERAMNAPFRSVPGAVPAHLESSVAAVEPLAEAWASMAGETHVRLRDVPLGPGRSATLVLHRVEPFTADARIVVARRTKDGAVEERAVARPDAQYWIGTVEGDGDGRAMLAQSAAGTMGFVQTSAGTAILSGPPAGTPGPLASFVIADLPPDAFRWDAWECSADALPQQPEPEGGAAATAPCRQLRIAVETDHELWQRFAGAPDQTAACAGYVATLFAGILQIYDADMQIRPHVSYLRLWETPEDPWDGNNTSNQLFQFRDHWVANMDSIPRDLAAMLSGRGLGGGVAWLRAACGSFGYSVSANLVGSFPYPLVDNAGGNWDIMVTAHEIGHNVGAPHTHNHCPEPADRCAPSGYFGQCQAEQACTTSGTIMSYCHLCAGGLANVQLGFHPLSRESIETYMAASCNTVAGASPPAAVAETVVVMQGQPALADVLANEAAANCEPVTLESVEATSAAGHAVTVVPPETAGGRPTVRVWAPPSFVGTDRFGYVVREQSGAVTARIEATVVVVPVRWPENPIGDAPGLTTRYYALDNPQQLPDFASLTPIATTTQPDVNYPSTGGNFATSFRADNVGATWNGWVRVDQAGIYVFSVESDDGSRLLVGDAVVVSNDGLHGMVERSGTIALAPGKHALRIEFFEGGGGAGCIARLEGPGIARAPIAASRLTRGGIVNRFDLSGDARVDGIDLGILLGAWGPGTGPTDFNRDGATDGTDLGDLLGNWGS
jgi:hypothetical protein